MFSTVSEARIHFSSPAHRERQEKHHAQEQQQQRQLQQHQQQRQQQQRQRRMGRDPLGALSRLEEAFRRGMLTSEEFENIGGN